MARRFVFPCCCSSLIASALIVGATMAAGGGGGGGGSSGGGSSGGGSAGGGNSGASGSQADATLPTIVVFAPSNPSDPHAATNAEIQLQRIIYKDVNIGQGSNQLPVHHSRLVYPMSVSMLSYSGPAGNFRITNGGLASWSGQTVPGQSSTSFNSIVTGNRTQLFLEQAATVAANIGNPNVCETADYAPFAAAVLACLRNNNLNYRVGLENAPPSVMFSYELEFQSRVWDSHFTQDTRQELLFFEEQGNSILTVQAMEGDQLVGNPVVLRSVDLIDLRNCLKVSQDSMTAVPTAISQNAGRVKLGKVRPDGTIDNQGTWAKFYAMDLNELGVAHLKKIRVMSSLPNGSGGGNRSAHVKVMAFDTSPAYVAQTMNFD